MSEQCYIPKEAWAYNHELSSSYLWLHLLPLPDGTIYSRCPHSVPHAGLSTREIITIPSDLSWLDARSKADEWQLQAERCLCVWNIRSTHFPACFPKRACILPWQHTSWAMPTRPCDLQEVTALQLCWYIQFPQFPSGAVCVHTESQPLLRAREQGSCDLLFLDSAATPSLPPHICWGLSPSPQLPQWTFFILIWILKHQLSIKWTIPS